jgi:hypothetical protein
MSIFDFSVVKQTAARVQTRAAEMLREAEDLEARHRALTSAPPHRDDVLAYVRDWGDDLARSGREHFQRHLDAKLRERAESLATGVAQRSDPPDFEAVLRMALAPQLQKAMAEVVQSMDWPTDVVPVARRQAAGDVLLGKARQLRAERKKLIDEAEASGLDFTY